MPDKLLYKTIPAKNMGKIIDHLNAGWEILNVPEFEKINECLILKKAFPEGTPLVYYAVCGVKKIADHPEYYEMVELCKHAISDDDQAFMKYQTAIGRRYYDPDDRSSILMAMEDDKFCEKYFPEYYKDGVDFSDFSEDQKTDLKKFGICSEGGIYNDSDLCMQMPKLFKEMKVYQDCLTDKADVVSTIDMLEKLDDDGYIHFGITRETI